MASSGVKKEASSVPADVDGNTWKKSLMRSCHHGFLIHQLYFYVEMTGPDAAAVLTILALLCFSLLLQLLFRYLIMRLLFCFSSFVTSRQLRWEHATLFLACLKVFCPTRCIAPLLILTPLTPQALIGFICKSWFLVGHSITIVFHPSCAFFSTLAPAESSVKQQSANVLIESIIL